MGVALIVAGAACAAYGVSVMLVWSGTWFFAVWYVIGATLAGVGVAVRTGAWAVLPGPARAVATCVGAFAVAAYVGISALVMAQPSRRPPDDLDYLVVLGAQVRADGTPSDVLRYRLEAARDYLADNPRTRCVVSGGQGPNEPCAEADAMAAWLGREGVEPGRILLEPYAESTVENVRFSQAVIDGDASSRDAGAGSSAPTVGIVTNDFHLYRAVRIAQAQGMGGAAGISAYSNPWFLPNNLLRECAAVAKGLIASSLRW